MPLINKKVQYEFQEYLVANKTLREIEILFENYNIFLQEGTKVIPNSSQRRELVQKYYSSVNWDSLNECKKILAVYEDILDEVIEFASYSDFKSKELVSELNRLLHVLEKNNIRYYKKKLEFLNITNIIILQNERKLKRDFAKEQLEKCKKKISEGDYSGAITNARSLVEDVICKEIYKQITGEVLESKGDLVSDWKELTKKLNLNVDKVPDDFLKQILRGLSSVVQGLASMRNKMSDGHSQNYKSEKHHAILAVNSALTLVEFLFDTLEFQKLKPN